MEFGRLLTGYGLVDMTKLGKLTTSYVIVLSMDNVLSMNNEMKTDQSTLPAGGLPRFFFT